MKGTVFLDRDGTIIEERNYLSKTKDVTLIKGAGYAISNLNKSGFNIFVVSNQSGIGRGYFSVIDVIKINKKIDELLKLYDAKIDGYYFCPHNPEDKIGCICRKPLLGLLDKVKKNHNVHKSNVWMIGDKMSDIEFAINGKISPILVKTGYGSSVKNYNGIILESIYEASKFIINENKK